MQDLSSGNLGMGTPAATTHNGLRVTSAAYLTDRRANLSIRPQSKVGRVLFENKKAVGVELVDGTRCECQVVWPGMHLLTLMVWNQ